MNKVYSQRHLFFFSRHLLTLTEQGFHYRNTLYTLDDVRKVYVSSGGGGPKRMGVHLADGRKILINAVALELNGVKPKTGFLSGTNDAFEALRAYFEGAVT
ncbi:hypothetical protein A167_02471 [Alcanivorax sp. S71-1-4]|uniref:hypothetical protein n=1 Tax=Alcanivorax sp. S71-1-4 TaxID=1177159 RepID=UPI00135B3A3C|nr:hypothetical protein [Alcanivorax sp. S71-1-4]KAF0808753.1 hypothetical protein A167_02471 [Alcanivorax sp. S71-1-4]